MLEKLPKRELHGQAPIVTYATRQALKQFDTQPRKETQPNGNLCTVIFVCSGGKWKHRAVVVIEWAKHSYELLFLFQIFYREMLIEQYKFKMYQKLTKASKFPDLVLIKLG